MSKNIKEIGKELLGKSLNSFHRKTGLTQLEKNNEMQDGILDGILSQVDDAYIEKTEQSNVIHLDGSGDGVVVLDSIEGNTMVNLVNFDYTNGTYLIENSSNNSVMYGKTTLLKPNTVYTIAYHIKGTTPVNVTSVASMFRLDSYKQDGNIIKGYSHGFTGSLTTNYQFVKAKFTTSSDIGYVNLHVRNAYHDYALESNILSVKDVMILEGDWIDKEISTYFNGLQSSFEENKEEDKYKIEILSKNKNLYTYGDLKNWSYNNGTNKAILECVRVQPNTTYTLSKKGEGLLHAIEYSTPKHDYIGNPEYNHNSVYTNRDGIEYRVNNATGYVTFTTGKNINYLWITGSNGATSEEVVNQTEIQLEKGNSKTNYIPHKSNKIKLLLNSPLLKGDKLEVVNGKLYHYHKMGKDILNGNESWGKGVTSENYLDIRLNNMSTLKPSSHTEIGGICDVLPYRSNKNGSWIGTNEGITRYPATNGIILSILKTRLSTQDVQGFKQWLQYNPVTVVYELEEPYYEEVLNEYGEPIILEGYENGTIYIDSTIVPNTTVRYTSKMESFKTLNEVSNNNTMLTNDVNDNIIPYMMDVDLMIMEKEMALPSQINIRKMEVLDMTSMQKRTQEMLERLIKGKSLTEQECKTRVTTYLHAGKITDAQAEELMLLIDEVYA